MPDMIVVLFIIGGIAALIQLTGKSTPSRGIDTLVVGQDAYIVSGHYLCKVKVLKVTPEGVEVQTIEPLPEILRFDNEGNVRDGQGTFEGGPWNLDAKRPFAE